jgi:hypothetical protein
MRSGIPPSSGTEQENGNHAKTPSAIADALIDGGTHFLVLPGAKATRTLKDGALSDSAKAFSMVVLQLWNRM